MPANRPRARSLLEEIQQTRPFRSDSQEAALALLRTASVVSRRFARVVEPHGISLAQYNVLRILRGAGPAGLPTLAIRDRMIDEGSTVTRLLDKLEEAGLVSRDRSRPDRRQVLCTITPAGEAMLVALDPAMAAADDATMSVLGAAELRTLIALLGTLRTGGESRDGERR
ncbi:MAG: MarR family winged helix-turn-helix transcriptional regulator [Gemmatimonas sp.]|uniref:MarR family winged helix-turn-helix transcriptional regulator n=1 Tax=Gemmatimonas sp. TaxID=1962908 RepID=UPI00391F2191|nr:MarR family transcriptional regulator [Gemmatimonadota bacterium]